MPIDWERVEQLRLEKFGRGNLGGAGLAGFTEALGDVSYGTYRHHLEVGRGVRTPQSKRNKGGVPLRLAEALAQAFDVPLSELLDGETRSAEYERGLHNGRRQALAEMHDALNDMLRAEADDG